MDEALKIETKNLIESWINSDPIIMKEYLVTGYESPRINMQSILTRHFFIKEIFGKRFNDLMEEEVEFSINIHRNLKEEEKRVEALESIDKIKRPRYLVWKDLEKVVPVEKWDTYLNKWSEVLNPFKGKILKKLKVLELACGSANDFRFFYAYGISDFLDYTGVDLSETNIQNSRSMFPGVDFRVGNALEIDARDNEYEYLIVSDLLEHLSLHGLETAVKEICRVVSSKLMVHFFSMQDIEEHKINPIKNYHWNWLSRSKTQQLFENCCKKIDIIRIRDFCKKFYGFPDYYNKNSHTFFLDI